MKAIFAGASLVLLAACAAPEKPVAPPSSPAPAGFREDRYLGARKTAPVYRIDPARSLLLIFIHKDGALAAMGHDHVAASRDLRGYAVVPGSGNLLGAGADLYFPLATLSVDEPALRREAGFTSEIPPEDVETTRLRMLRLLGAEANPFVRLEVLGASGTPPSVRVDANIQLNGIYKRVQLPAMLRVDEGGFAIEGETALRQTDFGITPFSVFGGALAVKDEVKVRFRIEGLRLR